MCGRIGGTIEAHHIYPKALYKSKALELNNGIALCYACHRCVVHAGKTFDLGNYKVFLPMFNYQMKLSHKRKFNEKYQERIG